MEQIEEKMSNRFAPTALKFNLFYYLLSDNCKIEVMACTTIIVEFIKTI